MLTEPWHSRGKPPWGPRHGVQGGLGLSRGLKQAKVPWQEGLLYPSRQSQRAVHQGWHGPKVLLGISSSTGCHGRRSLHLCMTNLTSFACGEHFTQQTDQVFYICCVLHQRYNMFCQTRHM